MAASTHNCRYCGEAFTPQPGKPGFVDECPECLHAKTYGPPPVDVVARVMKHSPGARGAIKAWRRWLLNVGVSESKVDERIAWMLATNFPDSPSAINEMIRARKKLESET